MQDSSVVTRRDEYAGPALAHGRIVACLDRSELAQRVVPHALAIARALGVPITLLRVLEARPAGETRADPVEWDIRRHEARHSLERLAARLRDDAGSVEVEVVEGHVAEQICLWATNRAADLVVLGAHGEGRPTADGLGGTARNVLDRAPASVLLVPASVASGRVARYRRILVPVDGSSRAESVLPFAIRLAEAAQAELLLTYVVPVPELIEVGPLESDDLEMCERIVRRNERVAREYLNRIRARAARNGLRVRTFALRDGDVRSRLARLVGDERVDLIVLSAHGHSGRADVPYGSVTAHLMTHSAVPLLVLQPHRVQATRVGAVADRTNLRLPDQSAA